ncbi:MAG: cyanobactin biosynthesis system PatB/AcyB/McaB family protein [Moorea sp. SIO3C2]|nr:cyanobactin biosynthesis system PatB/AcyB/McaB family protein [Moorena sp. SIO3C2]
MKLPKQSVPVKRPDLIDPSTTVDLQILIDAGAVDELRNLKFYLLHGANYNNPMRFLMPANFCGCQIFSGQSRARCSATCGGL